MLCHAQVVRSDLLDERDVKAFSAEVALLGRLAHPNIVRLLGYALRPPNDVVLVTELAECDLYDYIHRQRQVPRGGGEGGGMHGQAARHRAGGRAAAGRDERGRSRGAGHVQGGCGCKSQQSSELVWGLVHGTP